MRAQRCSETVGRMNAANGLHGTDSRPWLRSGLCKLPRADRVCLVGKV